MLSPSYLAKYCRFAQFAAYRVAVLRPLRCDSVAAHHFANPFVMLWKI